MPVNISRKYLYGIVTLLVVSLTSLVAGFNPDHVCALVKNNTLIGDPNSCSNYFQCTNGNANPQKCANGQLFDQNLQQCAPEEQVNCLIDNPCGVKKNTFVGNPYACSWYYWCDGDGEPYIAECRDKLIFNADSQTCGYSSCTENEVVYPCEEIFQDNILFGSPQSCSLYLKCENKTLSSYTCRDGEFFNVATAECADASQVNCTQVTGDTSTDLSTYCETGEKVPCPDHCMDYAICNGTTYITCDNCTCPLGEFFDTFDETCKPRLDARTDPNCDRCETANLPSVVNVGNTCNTYLLCENGTRTAEVTCNQGLFFNETSGNCVAVDPKYAACSSNIAT